MVCLPPSKLGGRPGSSSDELQKVKIPRPIEPTLGKDCLWHCSRRDIYLTMPLQGRNRRACVWIGSILQSTSCRSSGESAWTRLDGPTSSVFITQCAILPVPQIAVSHSCQR